MLRLLLGILFWPLPAIQTTVPTAAAQDELGSRVVVVKDDLGETRASLDLDGCTASLSYRRQEPELLHLRNDCRQPLEQKIRVLQAQVSCLFGSGGIPPQFRTLYAGRLVVTFPEMAQRLAVAAWRSPRWEGPRARRDSGFANRAVTDLANEAHIFGELEKALTGGKTSLRIVSVEKVLIAVPRETPFEEFLLVHGVSARFVVPFDSQVWFALR